jgi:hypothetical protein
VTTGLRLPNSMAGCYYYYFYSCLDSNLLG